MPKEADKKPADYKEDTAVIAGPDWIRQSNIYEVNIRQYTPEGTFQAFAASLPRLKQMGVDILWFMPVTPISKTDRKGTLGSYYAVADYKAINPEFGTLADFKQLVQQAHDNGFKVIVDWVANHTGADHPWLTAHPDFYNRDSTGKAKYAFDWSDTRDLNYDNHAMRDSMIASMKFWLDEMGIDGFRCDVAGEVPTDFWKDCIRSLRKDKKVFMLAEAEKPEMYGAGFDAMYDWDMFHRMNDVAAGTRNALSLDSVSMRKDSSFPANAARLYFTSNHDENSWNKADYGTLPGPKHAPFAVLTQTMKASLPLIYSGQEEPVLRAIPFFEKDNMGFAQYARAPMYKTLLQLRHRNAALATDAGFRKVSVGDDKALYAYVREKGTDKVLVILNLSNKEQVITIKDASLVGEPMNLFLGTKEPFTLNYSFHIEPWGYIVCEY
ncbi:alpha-amylase family glycosyl hydrolase [Paraflavitalea pollutisoli]|uniref:alpha-amylase family glycosyl hydrolase n=1 Tax=Paraflavitalea pollutisoli TaxID=3034143 RepID=UPI0023EC49F5|nr:alpha-amylase family glycosyl hydrolase [Paraflavitalea sp. H1-2-19X]